ncbi:hypothetical protein [Flavilitoribacter nigricans]|uniref:Neurotransmitter-gated ion-channel transmembrane domain-containing protein n=1 Tax=Flavilitoribacter nigricans (strain ATCC 23147 / DSM 23189 / NBRC 102662 / NCIMB 1420 / SS-2) TaxID=1122177 RepID=A0A2D0N1Y4_FLAN2|nr:hypothetical protein [Flavilitoribacter nigricans]PHN02515.1 hypothetical protein CRP01_31560 [Flavilitoribacter nigricans DSM 23189 = NBRC 102662]
MKESYILLLLLLLLPATGSAFQAKDPQPDSSDLFIGLTVLDVIEVDDTEENITAEFLFSMQWPVDSLWGREIPYAEDLVPRIELQYMNEVEPFFEKKIKIDERGMARFNQRVIGTFRHQFDFTEFPFDKQDWKLSFFHIGDHFYRLIPDTVYMGLHEDFIDPPNWRTSFEGVADSQMRGPGPDIKALAFRFQLRRNSKYYVWKVLVPIGLIVLMSWGVFWIRPEEISAQLTVSVTAILTLVAFQFSVSQLVPPLSYLTLLDKFSIGADFLVFLAFLESLVTSFQAQAGRHRLSARIDRFSRWAFPIGFSVFTLILFLAR